ncbi:MAG: DUF3108 domain-containing protein [Dokdonella sp.]
MKTTLIALTVALWSIVTNAFASASPIAPFSADYVVSRNGTDIGKSTISLSENSDTTWTLVTNTRGTSGLARMIGLDITEKSAIRWRDGQPETVTYDYRQNGAFKKRTRHAELDWTRSTASVSEGDEHYDFAVGPGTVDRHAASLVLATALARGNPQSIDVKVMVKDRVEDNQYTARDHQPLDVPAGKFDTTALETTKDRRTSTSWFAKSIGWVPVQIQQTNKSGDVIVLKLVKINR